MSLIAEIRKGEVYKQFVKILERTRERVNIENDTKEALALHAARTSRRLNGEDRYSAKRLLDANMRDLATRSRLVEIRVKNDKHLSHLREAMDSIRRHISTEYSEDLRDFQTADQRKAFVERVLKSANTFLSEGDSLLAMIDTLVKDLDQAGYSMRAVIELLKLLSDTKGRVL